MENVTTDKALNLVKLCVGADTVEDLAEWQAHLIDTRRTEGLDPRPRHVTRQWPRRDGEIFRSSGQHGSLYWVIRGLILVRQRIDTFEECRGEDGILRCGIVLDPTLMRVETRRRKVFQGWRYLPPGDAPPDLGPWRAAPARRSRLPAALEAALDTVGVVEPVR
ncbi:MAG: DUF1489 domain-containing protein [Pseudomonadota bacterium]